MSALGIVLIALGVVVAVLFALGAVAASRRRRAQDETFRARLLAANEALADARAGDRGWDLPVLEAAARACVERRHPDAHVRGLHLVQVIDRPGTEDDQARFHVDVVRGRDFQVLLGRRGGEWAEIEGA